MCGGDVASALARFSARPFSTFKLFASTGLRGFVPFPSASTWPFSVVEVFIPNP